MRMRSPCSWQGTARANRDSRNRPERETLAVVYSTLAPNLAWEGFGSTLKLTLDVSGAAPVKIAVETLAAGGSYTGGVSFDGRYAFGGGGHVARLDLRTPGAQPETLSHNLVQSCNASVSSSRVFTNALMYLNFPRGHGPAHRRRQNLGRLAGHTHRRRGALRDRC